MATTNTNFVNALGAGSGVDTQALAKNLVEATRAPAKALIDEKIAKSEARISGYGVIKYSLNALKTAYAGLNDLTEFSSLQASNTQPSAFGVVASASAAAGNYQVNVKAIAQAQRVVSDGFALSTTALNAGAAFDLSLSVNGGTTQTINVTTDTPAGVVSAINASGTGLTAQLIQTSGATPWKMVITGSEGAAQDFTLSSASAVSMGLPADNTSSNWLQSAQDAELEVNGVAVTRSTNTITDVVDGLTFNLYAPTTSSTSTVNGVSTTTWTPARIDMARDTSGITAKVEALVKAYNDLEENLTILGDRDSEVEQFGGSLANDSFLRSVRSQVRSLLISDSSAPGTTIQAARDIGLSFDRDGILQLDKTQLDSGLKNYFSEVAQVFTANVSNQSIYSTAAGGIAGDAVKTLDAMMRTAGVVTQQTTSAQEQVKRYKADLEKLEDQMKKLLERYTQQFATMESVVGSSNSLRDSLKGTFEGLANAYKR
jgi:flagellar hook-associated protein 2